MREIKFRAWDGVLEINHKMYHDVWFDQSHIYYGWDGQEEKFLAMLPRWDCCPIMQYTGYKDKNGKEIYESDIVKHHNKINQILWKEGTWKFGSYFIMGFLDEIASEDLKIEDKCEIIGNIYENPELLEEESGHVPHAKDCRKRALSKHK